MLTFNFGFTVPY